MEMNDLYSFDSQHLKSSFRVTLIGLENYHNNLIKAEYREINFPVVYKQAGGKIFTDILATGWPSLILISDRLKNLLEVNCATGWISYPIILKDKKDNQIEGYHGFSVKGVSGRKSLENYLRP